MKKVITLGLLVTALSLGLSGCHHKDKAESKKKTDTKKVVRFNKELVEDNKV